MAHPHTLLQALSASIIKKIRKNNKNNKKLIRQHKKIKNRRKTMAHPPTLLQLYYVYLPE